jgi:hypothetical protein
MFPHHRQRIKTEVQSLQLEQTKSFTIHNREIVAVVETLKPRPETLRVAKTSEFPRQAESEAETRKKPRLQLKDRGVRWVPTRRGFWCVWM